jgi:hypothetical protein
VVNHDAIFELVCCSFYLFSKQENVWKVLTFWVITLNLRERAGKMSQFLKRILKFEFEFWKKFEKKLLPISYSENCNASPYDPNFSGLNFSGHNFFVFISFRLFFLFSQFSFFGWYLKKKSVPASYILSLFIFFLFSAYN